MIERLPAGRRGRVTWTIVDQGLSSLSNLGLGLFAAHSLGLAGFGAFGLIYTTYLLFVGCSRALCSFTVMSRFSADLRSEPPGSLAQALGALVLISLPAALGCVLVAPLVSGVLRGCLLALAVCLPGLLLQDGMRFVFFARGEPARAALSDFIWAVGLAVAFGVLVVSARPTPANLLLTWGAVGTLAGLISLGLASLVPRVSGGLGWMRRHFDLGGYYFLEFLADTGSVPVATYALGALVSVPAAGAFRGAQLVLGPLTLLFIGGRNAAIPEGARMDKSDASIRRLALRMTAGLTAISLLYVGLLLAVPAPLGRAIMGDIWPAVHTLLLPLGLAWITAVPQFAVSSCLKVLQDASGSLRASMSVVPMTLAGGIGGAWAGGAVGASYGLLIANLLAAVSWWYFLNRSLARRREAAA